MRTAKKLKFSELTGFSRRLVENHYTLYNGYVNKLNEIEERLKKADRTTANATFSELGELARQEPFASHGIAMHESYFSALGGDGRADAKLSVVKAIARSFGSFDAWLADFKARGLAARGWVVLALNVLDGNLHNYSQDAHDKGAQWWCVPILIMDVYEHAYFIDYGTKRKDYVESFFASLNWKAINTRFEKAGKVGKLTTE